MAKEKYVVVYVVEDDDFYLKVSCLSHRNHVYLYTYMYMVMIFEEERTGTINLQVALLSGRLIVEAFHCSEQK